MNQIAQSVDMKFEKSWALKGKQSYLLSRKSSDRWTSLWTLQPTNLGLNLVSVVVTCGIYGTLPILAVGATNLVYNIPYVRNRLDQTIYGNYLWGPQPSYNISEFQENKVSRPYLVCNYYRKKSSMIAGNQNSGIGQGSRISFQRTRISTQETFLYKGYVVVHGRWLQILQKSVLPQQNGSIVRFASIETGIQKLCRRC